MTDVASDVVLVVPPIPPIHSKESLLAVFLKDRIRRENVFAPDYRQRWRRAAKRVGISADEALEFMESLIREIVAEDFKFPPPLPEIVPEISVEEFIPTESVLTEVSND